MYRVNYGWLHGAVRPYFEKHGIKLLKDDMLFIERCLSKIPQERHREAVRNYFDIFNAKVEGIEKTPASGLNGRFRANTFLREWTDQ